MGVVFFFMYGLTHSSNRRRQGCEFLAAKDGRSRSRRRPKSEGRRQREKDRRTRPPIQQSRKSRPRKNLEEGKAAGEGGRARVDSPISIQREERKEMLVFVYRVSVFQQGGGEGKQAHRHQPLAKKRRKAKPRGQRHKEKRQTHSFVALFFFWEMHWGQPATPPSH